MAMDGPGKPLSPSSSLPAESQGSGTTDSPQERQKKKRGRKKKTGRTVETGEIQKQGSSGANVQSAPDQSSSAIVQAQKSQSSAEIPAEMIKGRTVGKRMTRKEAIKTGDLMDQKLDEIKTFHDNNFACLPEINFVWTLEGGYSEESKRLQISMEQLRQLLDEHSALLDKTFLAISQNEAGRKQLGKQLHSGVRFRQMPKEVSGLVDITEKDALNQKYWTHRAAIAKYCALCRKQYDPCRNMLVKLSKMQHLPGFRDRIAEIISASIECAKVHSELMLCAEMLGKKTEMIECRQNIANPCQLVLLALNVGLSHFFDPGEHPRLRALMNQCEKYYLGWVENYDTRASHRQGGSDIIITNLICSCLVMDQPRQSIRFAHYFLEELQKGQYSGCKETLLLIIQAMTAFTFLYSGQSDSFAEQERKMNESAELLNVIEQIVRYTANNYLGTPEEIENLIFLFDGIKRTFKNHHDLVKARYGQAETLGDQLIEEEKKQAKQIHDRLQKREQRRRERETQRLESQPAKQKTSSPEIPEAKRITEIKTGISLHPGLQAGVSAYVRKRPLKEVQEAFRQVEEDSNAGVFDKVQAKYGYADIIAASLKERVAVFKVMAESVKQYDLALQNNILPSIESDIAFREALATYRESMQELMLDTLRMSQAFQQAWSQFFTQEDLRNDFIERLIELHDEMKQLTRDGEEIAKCCANIPDIYARRGEMIQSRGLSSKGNPERRRVMADNVRALEADSEQLRRSFNHLKQTINIKQLNKASIDWHRKITEGLDVKEESISEPVGPEVSVPKKVLPPVQPEPLVPPVPQTGPDHAEAEAIVSSEVISIPLLPPGLAGEIQQKTGRTDLTSEYGTGVFVETISFQNQQWLPDSGCNPHPLSLLARHLNTPLIVKTPQKRWYIAPGEVPVDADSEAIPKRSLKLEYNFAMTEPVAAQELAVEEVTTPISTETQTEEVSTKTPTPVATGPNASVKPVERPEPPLELPLHSLLPSDISSALIRSLTDTKEDWEATSSGLKKIVRGWRGVKKAKKGKKGRKGAIKTGATTPQYPETSEEKPEITTLNLQGLLRRQLSLFMDDPEYRKRHLPSGFNIDGVIKRACEGRLFMEYSGLHEDFCLLSKALNIPLRVAFRVSDVFSYQPDMCAPTPLGTYGVLNEDYLTLESYSSGGRDYWFASITHYFDWGDELDEAEAAQEAKQQEEKKKKSAAKIAKRGPESGL